MLLNLKMNSPSSCFNLLIRNNLKKLQSLSLSAIALTADDAKVSHFLRDLFDTLMFRNCESSRICLNFLLLFLLGLKMYVILEVSLVKLFLKILKAFVTKELKWIFSSIVKIML